MKLTDRLSTLSDKRWISGLSLVPVPINKTCISDEDPLDSSPRAKRRPTCQPDSKRPPQDAKFQCEVGGFSAV